MSDASSGEVVDRIAHMRERAEHKPVSFQFDDDHPEFFGNFMRWEQSPPHPVYGSALLAIFAEYPSGEEMTVWLYHRVLRNALLRQNPQAGELVMIKRGPKVQPDGGGNSYYDYTVVVERSGEDGGLTIDQARRLGSSMAGGIDPPEVIEPDVVMEARLDPQEHDMAMASHAPAVDEDIPF